MTRIRAAEYADTKQELLAAAIAALRALAGGPRSGAVVIDPRADGWEPPIAPQRERAGTPGRLSSARSRHRVAASRRCLGAAVSGGDTT